MIYIGHRSNLLLNNILLFPSISLLLYKTSSVVGAPPRHTQRRMYRTRRTINVGYVINIYGPIKGAYLRGCWRTQTRQQQQQQQHLLGSTRTWRNTRILLKTSRTRPRAQSPAALFFFSIQLLFLTTKADKTHTHTHICTHDKNEKQRPLNSALGRNFMLLSSRLAPVRLCVCVCVVALLQHRMNAIIEPCQGKKKE